MPESDASLVARAARGDDRAADTLLRRHFRSSYLVALARSGNSYDAADICQEAFIKCLARLDTCRQPERFGAWLLQIVRNTAHNHMAYVRVRATDSLGAHLELASQCRSDAHLQQLELRKALRDAMAQLTPEQREVVLLHDLEGLTHHEVAVHLGISVLMSRRHLSDARKRLRSILGDYASLEPDHD